MSVARRVIIVVVGALVVVLGLGGLSILLSEGQQPQPSPSPTTTRPPERTLLLQVLDAEGYASANFVLGLEQDPDSTTVLSIPASLLVSAGDDTTTLGMTPKSADTLAAVRGVESTVGIRIDAALAMDRLAFAGLVDAVDGVWVKLPAEVSLPEVGDETKRRTVGPGWVKFDGLAAADYAVVRIPGEDESTRLARATDITTLVLEGLPRSPERMRQLLTSLGSLAQSSVPTEELVPFLLQVHWDITYGESEYAVLPVIMVRAGARPASVPAPSADELVRRMFPDALIVDGVTG